MRCQYVSHSSLSMDHLCFESSVSYLQEPKNFSIWLNAQYRPAGLLMMQLKWRWISTEWMWKDSKKKGPLISASCTSHSTYRNSTIRWTICPTLLWRFVQCCLESSFSCSWSTSFTWWLATALLYKWLAFHWGLTALHFLPNDALCVWISWSPIFSQQSLKHSKS